MGHFMKMRPQFTIPSEYNQFDITVSEQLHNEYYAKLKTGEIKPYIYEKEKYTYQGGGKYGYGDIRFWDQDWNWCCENSGQDYKTNKWPGDHPTPNHPWNTGDR